MNVLLYSFEWMLLLVMERKLFQSEIMFGENGDL